MQWLSVFVCVYEKVPIKNVAGGVYVRLYVRLHVS